ncbi:hypothetical protein DFH09DRAFT_1085878 [Mycena vulgaris]|nr:hypothetical protein DFH09DRAFT_1085878 [Mycena vulgaris]
MFYFATLQSFFLQRPHHLYRPPTFRRDDPSRTANTADIPLGSKRRHGEEDKDEPTSKRAKKIETAAKEPTQKPKKTPKKASGFRVELCARGTERAGWAGRGHGRIFHTASIYSDVAAASTALVLKGLPLNAAMRAAVQA